MDFLNDHLLLIEGNFCGFLIIMNFNALCGHCLVLVVVQRQEDNKITIFLSVNDTIL